MESVTKTSIDMETISQADLHTLLETSLNVQGKYLAELDLALKRSSTLPRNNTRITKKVYSERCIFTESKSWDFI